MVLWDSFDIGCRRCEVLLIAATGVRTREPSAMQVKNVRFKDNSIWVEQAFQSAGITSTKFRWSKPSGSLLAKVLREKRSPDQRVEFHSTQLSLIEWEMKTNSRVAAAATARRKRLNLIRMDSTLQLGRPTLQPHLGARSFRRTGGETNREHRCKRLQKRPSD